MPNSSVGGASEVGSGCFVAPPEIAQEEPGPDAESLHAGEGEVEGAQALAMPTPVRWSAVADGGQSGDLGAAALAAPSSSTLATIQASAGAWGLGWTSFPTVYKAPNFDFGTTSAPADAGVQWTATPTLTQAANEGSNVCLFLPAGRHKTTHAEGGKDVYWNMSAAMSARDSAAEGEHASDIQLAYEMSLKEAETVLNSKIVGKSFGPKPTKAEAEQLVLDTITANLTHAPLGNDKTKWADKYDMLFRKTLQRDSKLWHTFGLGPRTTNKAGDVTYEVNTGTTSVGVTPSATIVKY